MHRGSNIQLISARKAARERAMGGGETMDLQQLADYLQRDMREVTKLASRGNLPGRKVGGEWKFARAEINLWIEQQMHAYTEQQLTALETGPDDSEEALVSSLLGDATIAVPLPAKTRNSVLRELVKLAEQSWAVYDPEGLLHAIQQREQLGSTALASGVAIPHPRRAIPAILGESIVAFGRTVSGIPFGAPNGGLTDLYFLVCCRDDRTHLRVLARLSRLMLQPGFLEALRSADTSDDAWQVIHAAEMELLPD
jgi:PTS system nitrogen regulatory IIA component